MAEVIDLTNDSCEEEVAHDPPRQSAFKAFGSFTIKDEGWLSNRFPFGPSSSSSRSIRLPVKEPKRQSGEACIDMTESDANERVVPMEDLPSPSFALKTENDHANLSLGPKPWDCPNNPISDNSNECVWEDKLQPFQPASSSTQRTEKEPPFLPNSLFSNNGSACVQEDELQTPQPASSPMQGTTNSPSHHNEGPIFTRRPWDSPNCPFNNTSSFAQEDRLSSPQPGSSQTQRTEKELPFQNTNVLLSLKPHGFPNSPFSDNNSGCARDDESLTPEPQSSPMQETERSPSLQSESPISSPKAWDFPKSPFSHPSWFVQEGRLSTLLIESSSMLRNEIAVPHQNASPIVGLKPCNLLNIPFSYTSSAFVQKDGPSWPQPASSSTQWTETAASHQNASPISSPRTWGLRNSTFIDNSSAFVQEDHTSTLQPASSPTTEKPPSHHNGSPILSPKPWDFPNSPFSDTSSAHVHEAGPSSHQPANSPRQRMERSPSHHNENPVFSPKLWDFSNDRFSDTSSAHVHEAGPSSHQPANSPRERMERSPSHHNENPVLSPKPWDTPNSPFSNTSSARVQEDRPSLLQLASSPTQRTERSPSHHNESPISWDFPDSPCRNTDFVHEDNSPIPQPTRSPTQRTEKAPSHQNENPVESQKPWDLPNSPFSDTSSSFVLEDGPSTPQPASSPAQQTGKAPSCQTQSLKLTGSPNIPSEQNKSLSSVALIEDRTDVSMYSSDQKSSGNEWTPSPRKNPLTNKFKSSTIPLPQRHNAKFPDTQSRNRDSEHPQSLTPSTSKQHYNNTRIALRSSVPNQIPRSSFQSGAKRYKPDPNLQELLFDNESIHSNQSDQFSSFSTTKTVDSSEAEGPPKRRPNPQTNTQNMVLETLSNATRDSSEAEGPSTRCPNPNTNTVNMVRQSSNTTGDSSEGEGPSKRHPNPQTNTENMVLETLSNATRDSSEAEGPSTRCPNPQINTGLESISNAPGDSSEGEGPSTRPPYQTNTVNMGLESLSNGTGDSSEREGPSTRLPIPQTNTVNMGLESISNGSGDSSEGEGPSTRPPSPQINTVDMVLESLTYANTLSPFLQEASEMEGMEEETSFNQGSHKKDPHYVCPNALKRLMTGGIDSLFSMDYEEYGSPKILSRLTLCPVYTTIEENYPEGTLEQLFDLLQPATYLPKDVTTYVLQGILLNPDSSRYLCLQAFKLLMRTQDYHSADKALIPWDWDLLTTVIENKDLGCKYDCEILRMVLQYVVKTLEDDFHAKVAESVVVDSIAKATLSCDRHFPKVRTVLKWLLSTIVKAIEYGESNQTREKNEHLRMVSSFQAMLSLTVAVDNSPALNSSKLAQEIFHQLISNWPRRAHRMLLLESIQNILLKCKLLEHLLHYACTKKSGLPMSRSLLLYFLKTCILTPDPKDGEEKLPQWEELIDLLKMLDMSYKSAMKGYLVGGFNNQRKTTSSSFFRPEDQISSLAVREAVDAFRSRSEEDLGSQLPSHLEESLTFLQDQLLDVCQA